MTAKDFLEGGEWVGYYCYSFRELGMPMFDSMMSGMRFACSAAPNEDQNSLLLTTRGDDGCGQFQLQGTISANDGCLGLTKLYAGGNAWGWRAIMSPYGLIGTWGEGRWGGWLWLWKREWSYQP